MSDTPTRRPRRFWSKRSDYERLQREVKCFSIDLDRLESASAAGDRAWLKAARRELESVLGYLEKQENIEGGWVSLHAARRHSKRGLDPGGLLLEASFLRAEAGKISSWRAKEILNLVPKEEKELTVDRVIRAMEIRDEYFANQYHKLWLVGDQLYLLLKICGPGLLLLTPLLVFFSHWPGHDPEPWGYQMVAAVLFFGLLGAAFSVAGSLMSANPGATIPERVANQFVTAARAFFGAGAGLAGYAFYNSQILSVKVGDGKGPGGGLAIAFLFGFAGELLIARVLGTLGTPHAETQK